MHFLKKCKKELPVPINMGTRQFFASDNENFNSDAKKEEGRRI